MKQKSSMARPKGPSKPALGFTSGRVSPPGSSLGGLPRPRPGKGGIPGPKKPR